MKHLLFSLSASSALILLAGTVGVKQVHLQAREAPSGRAQYVAMGSSYGAGPGIGTRAPDSPKQCNQSAENYPHLLARKRNLALTDVTCGGATTQSILASWRGLPPQLDAVGPQTKLVTVTIGGNDVFFVGNLGAWSCENAPQRVSEAARMRGCKVTPNSVVDEAFPGLEDNMRKIVEGIRQRSPGAKVVFVDYITVFPSTGSCPDRMPLTDEEIERGRVVLTRLAALTEKVAKEEGAELLKASELTKGHDVCSSNPWVAGLQPPDHTSDFAQASYHPNAQAMQAIAKRLDQMLPTL